MPANLDHMRTVCACGCDAKITIRESAPHWHDEAVIDLIIDNRQVTVRRDWLLAALRSVTDD